MSCYRGSKGPRAEEIYSIALRNICRMMKNDRTTTNVELDKFGKGLFGAKWSGVYASDQKPNFRGKRRYAIMNLDESWMPGSHWIGLVKHQRRRGPSNILVYDSFGRSIKEMLPDLKLGGRFMDTEDDAEQSKQESSCGQRSLAALFVYDQFGYDAFMSL